MITFDNCGDCKFYDKDSYGAYCTLTGEKLDVEKCFKEVSAKCPLDSQFEVKPENNVNMAIELAESDDVDELICAIQYHGLYKLTFNRDDSEFILTDVNSREYYGVSMDVRGCAVVDVLKASFGIKAGEKLYYELIKNEEFARRLTPIQRKRFVTRFDKTDNGQLSLFQHVYIYCKYRGITPYSAVNYNMAVASYKRFTEN